MKWLIAFVIGCTLSTLSGAQVYVYHDGRETVSRVLSMSLSASTDSSIPALNNLSRQLKDGDLVITVGRHSFDSVCDVSAKVSIIALFLGEEEFSVAKESCAKNATAVLSGAPLGLRLEILQTFWEDRAPIAIVHSANLSLSEDMEQLAKRYGMSLYSKAISEAGREQTLQALTEVLDRSNLVLSLYDSMLFDSQFSKDAIRLMFHRKKALVAHSLQLVRAGALFAVYSTSKEKLGLVATYINAFEESGNLLAPAYPTPLRVAFNPYLIRMYSLILPTDQYLITELGVCPESGCQEPSN